MMFGMTIMRLVSSASILFGGILLRLAHAHADLLREGVAVRAQLVGLGFRRAQAGVQVEDLVHERQLLVLEFPADVFLDGLRVLPDEFDVQHLCISCYDFFRVMSACSSASRSSAP